MTHIIVDDIWKVMMRRKMKDIERFISGLDSEQLVYLVDYAVTEMDIRSDKLQKQHEKGGKKWVN